MKLKQLIYFSWNENNKKKGYHVFAKSNGIDERDINTIVERLRYFPPKNMTDATVEKLAETSRLLGHPSRGDSGLHFTVQREIDALFPADCAFFMLPSGECCCAKVTYCGVDWRLSIWGNHIIHAYIFPYDPKISPASVFFSQKFKTTILPRELAVCETQRPLPIIEIDEQSVTLEELGRLVKAKGTGALSRVLDCVFASLHEDMDIYINGTEQDILFWMLACQSLLPTDLVMLLSFSTCRFSDSDSSPFRIKHIVTRLGSHYAYKLSSSDATHISIEPKNKVFSEKASKLKLSSLMTYLLLTDPSEAQVLRDLIGTYIKINGVIDSEDICLIYRLARTDIYDGISELELCEALGGVVLRSFGHETVDHVIEKYLDYASDGMLKVKLYGLLASYHSRPEKIMDNMFDRVLRELVKENVSAHDVLDMLVSEDFGKDTFRYILRGLDEKRGLFEQTMTSTSARSFAFRFLFTGFCDFGDQRAADLLIELIESAVRAEGERDGVIPECINELISVVEFDEMTYRRVIYGYYDYCRITGEFSSWCTLVVLLFEQGRKLSSEAGLCAFIMRELEYGVLIEYMKRGDREAKYVLSMLFALRRFGAISERAHSNFIYDKFGGFLSCSADKEIISFVVGGLKNENERLLEALVHYAQSTEKRMVFDIYKKEIGDSKSEDKDFLESLYNSEAKYIGTAMISFGISTRNDFISYLNNWYSKGYYKKCFPKAFTRLLKQTSEGEMWHFLSSVFVVCKDRFSTDRKIDFGLWTSALATNIENYIGKESDFMNILSGAKEVTLRNGSVLPTACEIILETEETLGGKGDISFDLAVEFTEKASENLKDVYVRTYGIRLMGLCVSDMDTETISAAIWMAIMSSDRENFKKLIKSASRLGSAAIRILLSRITDAEIIEKDPDKVEEMLVSLAKCMKSTDYLALRNKVFAKYGKKKYSTMFEAAEEKFGIVAKKKLEMIK